jgi:TRAP-type C4-dicarboxylate transport system substrate-binding protein
VKNPEIKSKWKYFLGVVKVKIKKRSQVFVIIGTVCILLLTLLAACSSPSPAPTTPAATTPAATTPGSSSPAATTPAEPVKAQKLTFASFRPENDYWVPAFKEWVKDFEEKTGGRYTIEMNWGGGMGAAKDYYNMLTSGVFDLANYQQTQLPGRFPISELLTLPIEAPSISAPTMAFHQLYKNGYLDKEFSDSKVLFVWGGAGNTLAQNKRSAATIEEMKGIKVGNSGGYAIDVLTAAGAVPVNMALGERYISIEKGLIDGTMGTWAALYTTKIYEVVNYVTEPGVCSFPFVMLMNKQTYEKLPQDVQAIVDEMAQSDKYSKLVGELGDADIEKGKKAFADKGGTVVQWNPADYEQIGKTLTPVWEKALADTEAKGYPAQQAVADLYKALKDLGVENPFVGYTPAN